MGQEPLTGPQCKALRLRWDIHVHHLADACAFDRKAVMSWERRTRTMPADWRAHVTAALRKLVLEIALETAVTFGVGDPRVAGLVLVEKPTRERNPATGAFLPGRRVRLVQS